jgi:hypothetical protein
MSIQSVDDFDPTSSTPVFGSTVSQTKIQQQQQPINDLGGAEKLVTPPQPVVNGQNDKTSDNLGNGTTQSVNGNTGTNDSTSAHVNGKNEKSTVDTVPSTNDSVLTEKSSQQDPLPASSNESTGSVTSTTEPEPALSTTTNVAKEDLSAAPATVADTAPPPVETATSNEDVPASATAPEATVSATPEHKSKVMIFFF